MGLKNTLALGTAALGLTLATVVCNDSKIQPPSSATSTTNCNKCPVPCDKNYETQRQLAIRYLEKNLNIQDSISVRHRILNDSTYTKTYPNGEVERYNLTITPIPRENPNDTSYCFDFHNSILPYRAIVNMKDGKVESYTVQPS
jgi:hypothetical protein